MANLLTKTEQALAGYATAKLTAAVVTANVYAGESMDDKALPEVICLADNGPEEDPPQTGNFWVMASVTVKSTAAVEANQTVAGVKAAHDLIVETVFNPLTSDDLPSQLSAQVVGFTCMAGLYESLHTAADEDVIATAIRLKLYCCASDI